MSCKEARRTCPAIDRTRCIDRSFMQSYLNYLSDRPHTNEQLQFHTNNISVMLTEPHHWHHCLSPWFSLYVTPQYYASGLTSYPSEIWTSNLSSEPTSPHEPYLLIDTASSRRDRGSRPHVFSWNMASAGHGFHFQARMSSSVNVGDREWLRGMSLLPHTCCTHYFVFLHLVIRLRCPH